MYRPPKYHNDFIREFSNFLSYIVPLSDLILIVGDFTIHVCCPGKPMVAEILEMLDSFNLTQSVTCSTHEHGHSLDLVLSLVVSVVILIS